MGATTANRGAHAAREGLVRPPPAGRIVYFAIAVLASLWAAVRAAQFWWTADDAFLSFRCARNLIEGAGLVFNPGERVEVFTNPLWTLWCAAGLALHVPAEVWANLWGIAAYVLAVALLGWNGWRLVRAQAAEGWVLPVAAAGAALHTDWSVFATSGLETSLFTLLLLGGFLATLATTERGRTPVAAGVLFAAAALTRHDGVLAGLVAGAFLLAFAARRFRTAAVYTLAFGAAWIPFTIGRVAYYGDIFPNSYYAKSAELAWYSQGLHYLGLYLDKYAPHLAGPLLIAIALAWSAVRSRLPRNHVALSTEAWRQALLAGAIATVYTVYVVRVGGDFMYARLLVPVSPFLLVLLEIGALALFGRRFRPLGYTAIAAILAGTLLLPAPVTGDDWLEGVTDERKYYSPERLAILDDTAAVLERYLRGLPVRVAFYGGEARVAYRARLTTAIEAEAGLTDPAVARRPLSGRGRPGHEKPPSAEYLIRERHADLAFSKAVDETTHLDRHVPEVLVHFEGPVWGRLFRWDPAVVAHLAERGARVPDFSRMLDGYLASLDGRNDADVAAHYERLRLFYFEQVRDPEREGVIRRRLGLP